MARVARVAHARRLVGRSGGHCEHGQLTTMDDLLLEQAVHRGDQVASIGVPTTHPDKLHFLAADHRLAVTSGCTRRHGPKQRGFPVSPMILTLKKQIINRPGHLVEKELHGQGLGEWYPSTSATRSLSIASQTIPSQTTKTTSVVSSEGTPGLLPAIFVWRLCGMLEEVCSNQADCRCLVHKGMPHR